MASRTQQQPYIILGNLADLPNPASVPQGYIFHAVDTGATFILHILSSTGTRQWDPLATITTVGASGQDTTYLGGTLVPPTQKSQSFTATRTEATLYEIDAVGLTATLSSTDPIGQRYEFSALGTLANPNFTLRPDGGKTITGIGGISQPSQNIIVQGFWQSVEKQSDGNWLLSGL